MKQNVVKYMFLKIPTHFKANQIMADLLLICTWFVTSCKLTVVFVCLNQTEQYVHRLFFVDKGSFFDLVSFKLSRDSYKLGDYDF